MRCTSVMLAAVLALVPVTAWCQSAGQFPSKPVRYVVPFGAGAAPDIVGRLVAEKLTRTWGQQVIVDNRVGVAGVLGTAFVAKSAPDGYNLIQCNIASSAIAVTLFAKMPYDQVRDLAPIARIGMTPNILTVHPSLPVKTVKQLVAYAKGHPGQLSYSSGLVGTSPQLSMELVKLVTKIDVVNVPYKNSAQGVTDNMAGLVPIGMVNVPSAVAPIQAGRLRPLAITSASRISQLPDVPTMQESGIPGYEVNSWYGLCAPAGTPAALLDRMNAELNSILAMPDIRHRFDELVVIGPPTTRDEFDRFIRAEIARWAKVIKDAAIPLQ
ncbi:MAG TPA: tripartite tricarboxylate transporter substrate binding protein [Burkholderiales bacterium]|nr:tripartite tricarboxylate transporter substrate binding protein [Burkholderiales bacterium]